MYRILIADDEGIVTQSLQFIIDRNFKGECETAVAHNGRQAIEVAETFRPDIALLDIQMPGINGLKAMEEIRTQNPKTRILILTAYNNFDYAKEAIRLGAVDYLMKPINKTVITERLTDIMHQIDAERQKREDDLQIREKMEAVIPIIENGFVGSLIFQDEYRDSGEEYRHLLNITEEYGIVLVMEWGEWNEQRGMENPIGSGVRVHRDYARLTERIKVYFRAFISNIMGNKVVCILPQADPRMEYQDRINLIEKARNLKESLQQTLNADCRIGIGSVQPWASMNRSYQEALKALRHGKRGVTHIDDLLARDTRTQQQQTMEQNFIDAVCSGNEREARQEASVYAEWLLQNQGRDLTGAAMQLTELLLVTAKKIEQQGGMDPLTQGDVRKIYNSSSGEEIQSEFIRLAVLITQAVVIQDDRESDNIIQKARTYIDQNYARDLSLDDVAREVGISPYYFSKLFKEQTGQNFIDYLTGLRIETAKHLLEDPAMSVKEICIRSGYSNQNYFSRIFKKSTGMTPTEYRENRNL